MSQGLTLQINSLEALERLIGGDTEMELSIRQNIADAFAEKYLKSIVNTSDSKLKTLKTKMEAEVSAEIDKRICDTQRSIYGQITLGGLSQHTKSFVGSEVSLAITKMVQESVASKIKSLDIEAHIDKVVNLEVAAKIKAEVAKKLQKMLDKV